MARFARRWAPLLAFQALIFVLSSRPSVPLPVSVWDKALHFGAYAFLALLWLRVLPGGLTAPTWSAAAGAVALTVLYGLSDEIHQAFVPGRQASALDLLADGLGAASAVILLVWRRKITPARVRVNTRARDV